MFSLLLLLDFCLTLPFVTVGCWLVGCSAPRLLFFIFIFWDCVVNFLVVQGVLIFLSELTFGVGIVIRGFL